MDNGLFKKWHAEGLISDESFNKIEEKNLHPLFSVFWEVKTLLYVGILMLTSGLGILVYKNIDTIGHQVILIFLALICIGCFVYCFKHKKPFSTSKVQSPKAFFDYILLLGTVSFLIFTGYLQYEYHVFGDHYGMATFIPMLVLFYIAYNFDHVGILNMAIANLGIWMGVTVTPRQLLAYGTFNSQTIIFTYLAFSLLLLAGAWLTVKFNFKPHFKFSYQHYGVHIGFISLFAGYIFNYDSGLSILWLLAILALAGAVYYDSYKQKSFYFLLVTLLYSYFAVNCLMVRLLTTGTGDGGFMLLFFYFIVSAVGFVILLINLNKKLKAA